MERSGSKTSRPYENCSRCTWSDKTEPVCKSRLVSSRKTLAHPPATIPRGGRHSRSHPAEGIRSHQHCSVSSLAFLKSIEGLPYPQLNLPSSKKPGDTQ